LQTWLASPQARHQLTQQLADTFGVGVRVGQIKVLAWPQPELHLDELVLQTQPPLAIKALGLRSTWADTLRGKLVLAALEVQGVVLSQPIVDALNMLQQKKRLEQAKRTLEPEKADKPSLLPRHITLEDVSWVGGGGKRSTMGGVVRLSELGWLDEADLAVQRGSFAGSQVKLLRTDAQWTVEAKLGGGTVKGAVTWQSSHNKSALGVLGGQLQTRHVELAQLTSSPVLSGLLEAETTLSGRAKTWTDVVDVLQTQSHFTVRQAVVHGIDLAKAVRTVGLSRGGQTPLDTLAGQVITRGRVVQLSQLAASSGALSVTGQVRVAQDTALSGQLQVLLAEQSLGSAVGVPLEVSGTLAEPQVALTRSALLGAAIGTAILPGVGTGAGASLGDKLGSGLNKLFGR
jgi:hypothetical protein